MFRITKADVNCKKCVDLGEDFSLVYQKPEVFFNYYAIYYGQKYGHYYFRNSTDTLLDRVKFLDSGYFIMKDKKIIGGVLIKPNFMSDLFVVPPYTNYEAIADLLLKYIKKISDDDIVLQEFVESKVPLYERKGCIISTEGYWMVRPTEEMNPIILNGYEARGIIEADKDAIGSLLEFAYRSNPAITNVDLNKGEEKLRQSSRKLFLVFILTFCLQYEMSLNLYQCWT